MPISDYPFLHDAIEPHASGHLNASDGHSVYWECSGNPEGVPVLFLHGGPGGASRPPHRRFFDPDYFRFITFHQRGCGQSTPLGETEANTTQKLIADIELLRSHLCVDRWSIVGGSWGTALAIAYGEAHPEACLGFVLMGVTLGRQEDRHWWWQGTRKLFPEAFDIMVAALPESQRDDPVRGFHNLLMDPVSTIHLPAAKAVCIFSASTVGTQPSAGAFAAYDDPDVALPLARLFVHYCASDHFLQPNQLLEDLAAIRHLPCAIQASRYDVTTPAEAGWALHKAWPGSDFKLVSNGAHSLADESVAQAMLDCIESIKAWA
jgi:proline iminopeptidase